MKEENVKNLIQFVLVLVFLALAHFGFTEDSTTKDYLLKLAGGLTIALFISVGVWFVTNIKLIRLYLKTNLPWSRNEPIRISVAYLFRIKVNGKYLLVPNSRDIPGYQPVGGVFKFLNRETFDLFNKLGITDDCKVPRDDISEHDLRLKMKHRKNLLDFIRWFKSKKDREIDPWREFYEELIKPEILTLKTFPHIQYKFVIDFSELKFSIHHQILEYKHFEIYELQYACDAQKDEIKTLMDSISSKFIFASEDEIIARKSGRNQITDHTTNVL